LWEWDYQTTWGLRSELGGWAADLSSSFGRDSVKLGAENTLNPSIGPTSKTSFYMGRQVQTLWVNNLDLSRGFDVGLADKLNLAFGVEHRFEQFASRAGEPDSYRDGGYVVPRDGTPFGNLYGGLSPSPGLVSFTGTSPADATQVSRGNVAAYLDVSTKITPAWFVGVAGRFEHYSDSAGNTASGKFSTRLELARGLALRGGVNTGFRAPSLAQTAFSTTQNTATVVGNERVLTTSKFLPVDSAAARALGAQPLKPEKSLSFTAGLTFERGPVRLTVDGYQIRIDDRIVKTDFLGTAANGGSAIKAILVANGVTGVDSAQFFTNAIDTRTRGVDVVGEYTLHAGRAGTVRLNAAWSYFDTKILHVIANPRNSPRSTWCCSGGRCSKTCWSPCPRARRCFRPTGAWAAFPRWCARRAMAPIPKAAPRPRATARSAPSGWRTWNWATSSDKVTWSVGANNLFDTYPDRNGIVASDGSGAYGSFAPFGLSGGFYYTRVGVTF
jgi:iron complex outermembrane receptor protein